MIGFGILLAFNFIGYALQMSLHIPLPGNVIGLVLFTAALFAGLIKLEWVEEAAALLTRHMMLFFTPFVVGVVVFLPLIGMNVLPIAGGIVLGTLAVLYATGWVSSRFRQKEEDL